MSDEINIFIATDNLIQVTELKDAETDSYIDDATIKMALFEQEPIHPDTAAAVDKGDGKVGIPCESHGLTAGTDYIRVEGMQNYDGEYLLDATTSANELVITATYAAEIFTAGENIYVAVRKGDAWPISLTHEEADDDGYYDGILPDTLKGLTEYGSSDSIVYYLFVEIVKDTNKRTERLKCKAVYPPV